MGKVGKCFNIGQTGICLYLTLFFARINKPIVLIGECRIGV